MRSTLVWLACVGLLTGCLPPSGGGGSGDPLGPGDAGQRGGGTGGMSTADAGGDILIDAGQVLDRGVLDRDMSVPVPRDAGRRDSGRPAVDARVLPPDQGFIERDMSFVEEDMSFFEEDAGFFEEDMDVFERDAGRDPDASLVNFDAGPDGAPSCLAICTLYADCMRDQRPDFDPEDCAVGCEQDNFTFTATLRTCIGEAVCNDPDTYQTQVDRCFMDDPGA